MRVPWVSALAATLAGAVLFALPGIREQFRSPGQKEAWRRDCYVVKPEEAARRILQGQGKVVLLDVREKEEYDEFHIPGPLCLRITLRDLPTADLTPFQDADLVIPYCLKDLRGFEGAKILRQRGILNVGVFEKFGIYSWENAGFPTAGTANGKSDEQAMQELREKVAALPASSIAP